MVWSIFNVPSMCFYFCLYFLCFLWIYTWYTVRPRYKSGHVGTGAHPDKWFGWITGIECPLLRCWHVYGMHCVYFAMIVMWYIKISLARTLPSDVSLMAGQNMLWHCGLPSFSGSAQLFCPLIPLDRKTVACFDKQCSPPTCTVICLWFVNEFFYIELVLRSFWRRFEEGLRKFWVNSNGIFCVSMKNKENFYCEIAAG